MDKIAELEKRIEELEEELQNTRSAGNAKSQFLSYINHELRTPLHGVIGYLDLITPDMYEQKDELYSYISGAKNSAASCLDIVNNILDLAKIEAGKMEVESSDFSLTEVIDSAVSIITTMASKKGLNLIVNIERALPLILKGDALKLRQVIINIVKNAVSFTEKGSIIINAENKGIQEGRVSVLFSVTDTGIGIPKSKMDKLFKHFSQITASYTKITAGTGLGLIISRELVNLMGGDIDVESEEGKGSRFFFTLSFPFRTGI